MKAVTKLPEYSCKNNIGHTFDSLWSPGFCRLFWYHVMVILLPISWHLRLDGARAARYPRNALKEQCGDRILYGNWRYCLKIVPIRPPLNYTCKCILHRRGSNVHPQLDKVIWVSLHPRAAYQVDACHFLAAIAASMEFNSSALHLRSLPTGLAGRCCRCWALIFFQPTVKSSVVALTVVVCLLISAPLVTIVVRHHIGLSRRRGPAPSPGHRKPLCGVANNENWDGSIQGWVVLLNRSLKGIDCCSHSDLKTISGLLVKLSRAHGGWQWANSRPDHFTGTEWSYQFSIKSVCMRSHLEDSVIFRKNFSYRANIHSLILS